MHAIVLVGGRGTRLQPLTDTRPKPMLPILGRPFLEHQLRYLASHGVTGVTLACGFLPDEIRSYFGDGTRVGIPVHYAVEPEPLDTAGAIAFAARDAGVDHERVLACNGDVLTDLDIAALVANHERTGAVATIALTQVDDPTRYGLVRTGDDGAVLAFVEKPPIEECDTNLINVGTYVLEPAIIESITPGERVNIERVTFPAFVGRGLHAIGFSGYWNDIGTFASFRRAHADAAAGRISGIDRYDSGGRASHGDTPPGECWIHPDAKVASGAELERGASIGAGAVVEDGALITASVVLERAFIGRDATVRDSIIGERGRVEPGDVIGPDDVV